VNATPLILAAVGGIALVVAVWVLLAPSDRSGALARLSNEPAVAAPSAAEQRGDAARALRAQLQSAVGARLEKSKGGSKLADGLARADLKLRPAEWLLTSAAVSALTAALLTLRFNTAVMAPVGFGIGWLMCAFFMRMRQSQRRKKFEAQLAPTILAISGALKAGYTFGQGVDLVSKNVPLPMGEELARITREAQLGVPLVEALGRMVKRNDSEDLRLLLTAVQIQQQVGGNLAQILDTIEFTIRERIRIKGEIKTITSQARVSGYILIGLPFALGGILSLLAPSYFTPMLHQTIGLIMLGIGGFFLVCGYGIIRKIVNIKV
jgi:tight adherence protein B